MRSPIPCSALGRGALKGTCNLLADGIVQVMRALAAIEGMPAKAWAKEHGLERYLGSSVKGEGGHRLGQ